MGILVCTHLQYKTAILIINIRREPYMFEDKRLNTCLKIVLYTLAISAVIFIGWVFFRYVFKWILPFLIALLVAKLMEPLVEYSSTKLKIPRKLASGIFTLIVLGLLTLLVYSLASVLIDQLKSLYDKFPVFEKDQLPRIVDSLSNFVKAIVEPISADLSASITDAIKGFAGESDSVQNYIKGLIDFSSSAKGIFSFSFNAATNIIPSILVFFVATCVSTYLISSDYRTVADFLLRQMPKTWQERTLRTKNHLFATLGKWLKAQLTLMIVTFFELLIGFLLMGHPYAFLLAFFISLIDAMPILGTGTVLIPWAVVSLIMLDFRMAIWLGVMYLVILLVRNIIEPKIVGNQIGLHPLVTLVSMYVGLQIMGIYGFVLFPIILVVITQFRKWGYIKFWKD